MTRARWGALTVVLIAVIGLVALSLQARRVQPLDPPRKPPLALLTSLPIVFGEGFGLNDAGSPALGALSGRFDVRPISTTSAKELGPSLLLMAQPLAQTPENLVALDDWVRRGGRILLLADPLLEWPSSRPLGDPLRPPPMFADTGLLAHWGLRLDAPDERGRAERTLAGYKILTRSPGTLHGTCEISPDGLVAECSIGKGWAAVVADADLLDVQHLGPGASGNLPAVIEELARLKNR